MMRKMKGGAPHPPFPEPSRQGHEIDPMTGTGDQAVGEIPMGTAVKRFQKEDLHPVVSRFVTILKAGTRSKVRRRTQLTQTGMEISRSDIFRPKLSASTP